MNDIFKFKNIDVPVSLQDEFKNLNKIIEEKPSTPWRTGSGLAFVKKLVKDSDNSLEKIKAQDKVLYFKVSEILINEAFNSLFFELNTLKDRVINKTTRMDGAVIYILSDVLEDLDKIEHSPEFDAYYREKKNELYKICDEAKAFYKPLSKSSLGISLFVLAVLIVGFLSFYL